EALCTSAKQAVRDRDACALDWHIGFTSPTETLDELRDRQYRQEGRRLTRRPYLLDGDPPDCTWHWLVGVVAGFHAHPWGERRSKVKALPELAREGAASVQEALRAWQLSAPGLRLPGGLPANGFHGNDTSLLDAVELLDLHLPLARAE